jgi:hypothetical protein
MPNPDDPYVCAIEQFLYWRRLGLSHDEMLEAVGDTRRQCRPLPTRVVVLRLEEALILLRMKQRTAA